MITQLKPALLMLLILTVLTGLIYPNKHLQERTYSILPFLARYGLDLRDRLYDNVELGCPDHHLLTV